MNKTQKGAWFNMAGALICMGVFVGLYIRLFVVKKMPTNFGAFWVSLGFFLLTGLTLYAVQKKQSPHEVDKDERDRQIERRAVIAAFVSVWILLFAATVIPRFIVGLDGSIPVWSFAFINVSILLIVWLVYCVAVLVQYGRGGKDGQ
jgi:threonine/homoserine/homoserine lactone efflux protein